MLARYQGKKVLMLQGPNGWFFRRVARRLVRLGADVAKINFNAADQLFFPGPNAICYREGLEAWPKYLDNFVLQRGIDVVLLFGDCRPYHRAAIERAKALGIEVGVFEEGYLRPNHVTLETGGVNGQSSLPKDPDFYRRLVPAPLPKPRPVGNVMPAAVFVTIVNSLACTLFAWRFPRYQHHRDVNTWRQIALWGRGVFRKLKHRVRDRKLSQTLTEQRMPPFFIVALQVHLDSQMNYCKYGSTEEFLTDVVESFAAHAPKDCSLLIKHHPFDRPYRDYTVLLDQLRQQYQLGERLVYADVIPLPLALKAARGTVVINSTVGLSSVQVGTPTKCLGDAVYDMPGLTHQGPLDAFWQAPGIVDRELYAHYRYYLRTTNQLNGSVWTDLFENS